MLDIRPKSKTLRGKKDTVETLSEQEHILGASSPILGGPIPFLGKIQRILNKSTILFTLLILVFGLLGSSVGAAAAAYADYHSLTALASNGIAAVKRLPADLGFEQSEFPIQISDAQESLGSADIDQALSDFTSIQNRLNQPDTFISIAGNFPTMQEKLQSASLLSELAVHGLNIAKLLLPSLVKAANVALASPISPSYNEVLAQNLPVASLTVNDIQQIQQNLQQIQPDVQSIIQIIQAYSPNVIFSELSASQSAKIVPYINDITQIPQMMPTIQSFLQVAPVILGSTQPTAYLLLFMDPSELRATGGFQGNYAVVTMDGGKIGAIHLQDIYLIDKPYNSTYPGDSASPPNAFQSWWPFAPWGVRDANLSPDFPTSAALDLQQLIKEGGNIIPVYDAQGVQTSTQTVDISGVIAIEPAIIEQMLALSGPITIGAPYNVVVTEQNVQDLIHFFQLTPQGRALGDQVPAGQQVSSTNKRFTALVAQSLLKNMTHLSTTDLVKLGQELLNDTLTKDIQLYSSDPNVEQYIAGNHAAASLYTGSDDSLMVVDANISGNKGSRFIAEQIQDHIQLQADGSAVHNVTLSYDWHPPEIANGYDATAIYNVLYNANYANNGLFYREYVRIYTDTTAQLLAYSGWQTGIQTTSSDFMGRGMFGGYLNIAGNMYAQPVTWNVPVLTLRYLAPKAFTPGSQYSLVLQRQAGMNASYDITIDNVACSGQSISHDVFEGALTTDQTVSVHTQSCSG